MLIHFTVLLFVLGIQAGSKEDREKQVSKNGLVVHLQYVQHISRRQGREEVSLGDQAQVF